MHHFGRQYMAKLAEKAPALLSWLAIGSAHTILDD
jgi:hypothetical protein